METITSTTGNTGTLHLPKTSPTTSAPPDAHDAADRSAQTIQDVVERVASKAAAIVNDSGRNEMPGEPSAAGDLMQDWAEAARNEVRGLPGVDVFPELAACLMVGFKPDNILGT